jgi:AcrR family transcriptional regulator
LAIHYYASLDFVPQVLKEDVRRRIRESALRSFAAHGFLKTTMEEVATQAGMATANVYRYYPSKADLFYDVVPDDLVDELELIVFRRIQDFAALAHGDSVRSDVADEQMNFWLAHRLEAVIVLAGSAGTRHEGVVARLSSLSVQHMVDALPPGAVGAGERQLLESIWDYTPRILARILAQGGTASCLRATITSFWEYQIAGLTALLRHLKRG